VAYVVVFSHNGSGNCRLTMTQATLIYRDRTRVSGLTLAEALTRVAETTRFDIVDTVAELLWKERSMGWANHETRLKSAHRKQGNI